MVIIIIIIVFSNQFHEGQSTDDNKDNTET